VKEGITTVTKEAGFQDVSDNEVVEFLESHSLPFTNKSVTGLDKETYEEAQDDHDE
jgi:hypothetical protein